jgi:DNA end-binding protein Ku
MARALWKGAIVFGLVNIPVDLYPGARSSTLDLDWIDKRDMSPVGYQRINKSTGKPVDKDEIVKGYQYQKGRYVILSEEDFKQANPKATQTVDIKAFVPAGAISPQFFETPYRLAPGKRGEKGYALLREALRDAKKIAIAEVVIRSKQHLAAVMVDGDALVLELLRWEEEILDPAEFELPAKSAVNAKELELAKKLVDDMTEPWKPGQYHDTYREDIKAQIERKVKAGRTEEITEPAKETGQGGAQVIDLMAALKQSLESKPARRKGAGDNAAKGRAANDEDEKPAAKRTRAATKPRTATKSHGTARKRA